MTNALMIVGTMSNAGKSLVTAGLCRVLHQDGKSVAPFKSQNMALNSYITRDGAEMGRAQVVQAEAAGIEPSALMNPILLKPTSDKGSQVIVLGEAIGTMTAGEYYKMKHTLRPKIMEAFDTLASDHDVIVIEGAGSPAEININKDDFVNMGMAKMAKAPVLLVADIDRGGVFASIYGTVMLMDEEERSMIKGIIINKFRGDIEILRPGLKMIEEKIGIPGISLRYVKNPRELGNPDMIIIPGTKNTIGDLKWLRQSGMEAMILKKASKGTVVFGVCGGYQMLGKNISDPYGVEEGGDTPGLGLLNVETSFIEKKRTIQMKGNFGQVKGIFSKLSGMPLYGYEIHSGVTEFPPESALTEIRPVHEDSESMLEGSQNVEGSMNVYGTYVHGVFDRDGIAAAIVEALLAQKGLKPEDIKTINFAEYKKQQYDILADGVRKNLDMDKIREILEAGL